MCIAEFLAVASGSSIIILGTILGLTIYKIRKAERMNEKSPSELKG